MDGTMVQLPAHVGVEIEMPANANAMVIVRFASDVAHAHRFAVVYLVS
jgi:hypothetical protein